MSIKKSVLVIENKESHFNSIKEVINPSYDVLPEIYYGKEMFLDMSTIDKLMPIVTKLIEDNKDNLGAIIIDANLLDNVQVINNWSGVETFLKHIRNLDDIRFQFMPIVIFSAFDDKQLKEKAFDLKGTYFLAKNTTSDDKIRDTCVTELLWVLNSLIPTYGNLLHNLNITKAVTDVKETMLTQFDRLGNILKRDSLKIEVVLALLTEMTPNKKQIIIDFMNGIKNGNIISYTYFDMLQELEKNNKLKDFVENFEKGLVKEAIESLKEVITVTAKDKGYPLDDVLGSTLWLLASMALKILKIA